MGNKAVIQAHHLSKQFKNETALKDISFAVHPGQIFGFLGPSGAGKTTTIKILTGQLIQSSGKAYVLSQSVEKVDETIYRQIGIVTDNSGLYERLSVYENLNFFAKLLNVDKTRIDYLLEQVGLLEEKKKTASKLSKGMKQRLVLTRSILHQPDVLFLDEPTNGLDPGTAESIHTLLKELKRNGTAIFLTTHNMEEATKLCDKVALLNDGKIVEMDSPKNLSLKFSKQKQYRITLVGKNDLILKDSKETQQKIFEWMKQGELQSIHSCEPTLENIFLEVTGRNLA